MSLVRSMSINEINQVTFVKISLKRTYAILSFPYAVQLIDFLLSCETFIDQPGNEVGIFFCRFQCGFLIKRSLSVICFTQPDLSQTTVLTTKSIFASVEWKQKRITRDLKGLQVNPIQFHDIALIARGTKSLAYCDRMKKPVSELDFFWSIYT